MEKVHMEQIKYGAKDKKLYSTAYRLRMIQKIINKINIIPMVDFNLYISNVISEQRYNFFYKMRGNKDFINIINTLNNKNNLQYIKSGSTGHTFMGLYDHNNEKIKYAIKVVAYAKKNITVVQMI